MRSFSKNLNHDSSQEGNRILTQLAFLNQADASILPQTAVSTRLSRFESFASYLPEEVNDEV